MPAAPLDDIQFITSDTASASAVPLPVILSGAGHHGRTGAERQDSRQRARRVIAEAIINRKTSEAAVEVLVVAGAFRASNIPWVLVRSIQGTTENTSV